MNYFQRLEDDYDEDQADADVSSFLLHKLFTYFIYKQITIFLSDLTAFDLCLLLVLIYTRDSEDLGL